MDVELPGSALIVAGTLLGVLVVVALWRRLPSTVALALLMAAGASVGAGGVLVQEPSGVGDVVVALVALGALTPLHCRLVFGRPGPVVAAGREAA